MYFKIYILKLNNSQYPHYALLLASVWNVPKVGMDCRFSACLTACRFHLQSMLQLSSWCSN